MSPSAIAGCLLVIGCAALPPAPVAVPAPPPVPAAVVEPTKPAAPSPVAAAAKQEYTKVERREVPAIISPAATPESVTRVHRADIAARKAVCELSLQDGHPTAAAKAELRRAMDELINATEAKP
jgi:hypothetical protein